MTLKKLKQRIDRELTLYSNELERRHKLKSISPLLFSRIKEFVLRDGKRIRPILFVIGYLGFSDTAKPGLYRSAVSIELLHAFMLIHDDIIDKSPTRRGLPSMHAMFNTLFKNNPNVKFSGEDLAIIAGDVLYAMALHAFLSIKENPGRKEQALLKLIESALFTGSGEFIELLYASKNIDRITKNEIYRVYDLKTANYTFSSPLTIGATLAGASQTEIKNLYRYGINLGRAFQINDDILGLFGDEEIIGKSVLTDLQEAKNTLLLWDTYKHSTHGGKRLISGILSKKNVTYADVQTIKDLAQKNGSLDRIKKEIAGLVNKANTELKASNMQGHYKELLNDLTYKILAV